MGLPEDAPMDDVDKRYAMMLKKQRSQQTRVTEESTSAVVLLIITDQSSIQTAFTASIKRKPSLAFEQQYYSATHRKWKLDKLDHFWQYNKFRIIIVVLDFGRRILWNQYFS